MNTKIRKIISVGLVAIFFQFSLQAQEKALKEQAMEAFKSEHYDDAVRLMEKALIESPNNAEIYYYLGFFNHYILWDSRPLAGKSFTNSQRVFDYLSRAIELDPKGMGNARYFYGSECAGNAFVAAFHNDAERVKYFYQRAYNKGAFPPWLIEIGKNILDSFEPDAIFFVGGDATWNVTRYLQVVENYRTDVTTVALAYMFRPWYARYLRDGLDGVLRSVSLNLNDYQIMNIHPYKWRTTTVPIPVSDRMKAEFSLTSDHKLEWSVIPDFWSGRMHMQIAGQEWTNRTYLSPQRALLLQIIEENFAERPVYFCLFTLPYFYEGLENYLQISGLTLRLVPVNTIENSEFRFNISKLENLLQADNVKYLPTVMTTNQPRISGIVSGYHVAVTNLLRHYAQTNQLTKKQELFEFYKSHIQPNVAVDDWGDARWYHFQRNAIMEIMGIAE